MLPAVLRTTQSASPAAAVTAHARSFYTSLARNMSIEASIRAKLTDLLKPQQLTIRNDSAAHAHHAAMVAQGGGNGETHFHVEVVSDVFDGKTQIARHRMVNGALKDEFDRGLHALSLRTKTPAEEVGRTA